MQISKPLLQRAVREKIISQDQANQLWGFFEKDASTQVGFNIINLLFYLGGFIAICSVTILFSPYITTLGIWWIISILMIYLMGAFLLSQYFIKQGLEVPAALCLIFIIGISPLLMSTILNLFHHQSDIFSFISVFNENKIFIELFTFTVAALLFYRYGFSILLMPLCILSWYLFCDLPKQFFPSTDIFQEFFHGSLLFGLLSLVLGLGIDLKTKGQSDYSFWLYFFGANAFWLGLTSLLSNDHEWTWILFLGFNLLLLVSSVVLYQKIFIILGSLGSLIFMGHLTYVLFEKLNINWVFASFLLTMIGLLIIRLGIFIQKNSHQLIKNVFEKLPKNIQELIKKYP